MNGLRFVELAVPRAAELQEFWVERGLELVTDGRLATLDGGPQLGVAEAGYRQLSAMHLTCDSDEDLRDVAARLDALGLASAYSNEALHMVDPVFGHRIVIEVDPDARAQPAAPAPPMITGSPRGSESVGSVDITPRRLGHVVLGTRRVAEATAFYIETLGFRITDRIAYGAATFSRVGFDHHNLLIIPGRTSYLNHYAFEMPDLDTVSVAAGDVLKANPESHVVGLGRHSLGSNVFWYMQDPAGSMFEYFSGMDCILDDADWEQNHRRDDWTPETAPFSVWGQQEPEIFFEPADLADIGRMREQDGVPW